MTVIKNSILAKLNTILYSSESKAIPEVLIEKKNNCKKSKMKQRIIENTNR